MINLFRWEFFSYSLHLAWLREVFGASSPMCRWYLNPWAVTHTPIFVLQILGVSLPTVMFMVYTAHKMEKIAQAKKLRQEERDKRKKLKQQKIAMRRGMADHEDWSSSPPGVVDIVSKIGHRMQKEQSSCVPYVWLTKCVIRIQYSWITNRSVFIISGTFHFIAFSDLLKVYCIRFNAEENNFFD